MLGNVVISKKFLRTRKIMMMHSNERGECSLHTLVDRSQKRCINAVDVVVRLHDPTDPSTVTSAPPSFAHVQLDDIPRTLDPAKCRGRVPSARWCGDSDCEVIRARLCLSTT